MNPYFYVYKSIGITWFVLLSLIAGLMSYYLAKNIGLGYLEKKDTIEDIFFMVAVAGFIGARLTYVTFHFSQYKENLFSIIKPSHMNLNLGGAIIFGIITLWVIGKREKISFQSLMKTYMIPFYFSMAIGIWAIYFDGSLVGAEWGGLWSTYYMGAYRHPVVLYLSILFLCGVLIEFINLKRKENKYFSITALTWIIIAYYMIKGLFLQ